MSKIHTGSEIIHGKGLLGVMEMLYHSNYRAKYESIIPHLENAVVVPEEKWLQIEKARKIIKDLLEKEGWAVRLCRADIEEALKLLSSEEELRNMIEENKEPHNPEETSFARGE